MKRMYGSEIQELYKAAKWQVADNRDLADNLAELWSLIKGTDGKSIIGWILSDYRNACN